MVAGLFVSAVTLWITRDIGVGSIGWNRLLPYKYKFQ
jgi:hypothetical protein